MIRGLSERLYDLEKDSAPAGESAQAGVLVMSTSEKAAFGESLSS